MACQASNSIINKPYDDELCRVGLYDILECFLINERADCSTIIAISKDLIDYAVSIDSSIKVRTENFPYPKFMRISGENDRTEIEVDLATSTRFDQSISINLGHF